MKVVERDLLVVSVYFFTPSTHTSIRASVPVMVDVAVTVTGEWTVEPFTGEYAFTAGEDGGSRRTVDLECFANLQLICSSLIVEVADAEGDR